MQIRQTQPFWRTGLTAGLLALAMLGGCAQLSERAAVDDIKRNQKDIPYQDDVKTSGNKSIFGFRSLPKRAEAAVVTEKIDKPAAQVSQCLQAQLQSQFKLPEDFFQVNNYANNAQTIALVNPFTKKQGLLMDITQRGVSSSEVNLYANGATLSNAWKRLPARCR